MFGRGKLAGPILIVVGVAICGIAAAFMGVGLATENLAIEGAALGLILFGCFPLVLFAGVGAYLLVAGRREEAEREQIRKKERILGLIQAQGQVSLGEIMLEMEMDRQQVTNAIYELVSMGLFSGYSDWDALVFYSSDAARVGSNQCPNCGGIRELVGQGVVKCPYCGVSLFVPPGTEQTRATPIPPPDQDAAAGT